MTRWLGAGRLTAAMVMTLMMLGACGGGGSPGSPPPAGGGVGTDKDAPLVPAQAGGLTTHFRERLAATEKTALTGPRWAFGAPGSAQTAGTSAPTPTPAPAAASLSATDTADHSSAVLQEAGVDEGDVLVTDGARVYALGAKADDGTQSLTVRTVTGGGTGLSPEPAVPLPTGYTWDMLHRPATPARLVATGQADTVVPLPAVSLPSAATLTPVRSPMRAGVRIFDLVDPTRPGGGATLTMDGRIQASRMIGSRLWLVLVSEPRFDGFDWSWQPTRATANRNYIASLSASALLPTISRDGGTPQPLVSESDCFVQPDSPAALPSIVTIVSIDLAKPELPRQARCFAGSTETVYMTPDSLYLATVRYPYTLDGDLRVFGSTGAVTDLHKFALSAEAIRYRGSGVAPGRLSWGSDTARFMLSESGSDLRVVTMNDRFAVGGPVALADAAPQAAAATSSSAPTPAALSPAVLTVLRDTGKGLSLLVTLPNADRPAPIGKPGEQVYAVRFIGPRAYVVTYRRTDPLYVIDLSVPNAPGIVGELVVPGFSERLYPLTGTLLLGVGHDGVDGVTTGVRVSLIDVTVPAHPVERASRTIGARGSTSAADLSPQGTMIRRVGDRIRVALPVDRNGDARTAPTVWQPFTALEAWRFVIDPVAGTWTEPAPVQAPLPNLLLTSWDHAVIRDTRASWLTRSMDLGDTSWLYYDGRFTSGAW